MSDNPLLESDEDILRRQLKTVFRQSLIPNVMICNILRQCMRAECFGKEGSWQWLNSDGGNGDVYGPANIYGIKTKDLGIRFANRSMYPGSGYAWSVVEPKKLLAKAISIFKPEYVEILELEYGAATLIKASV